MSPAEALSALLPPGAAFMWWAEAAPDGWPWDAPLIVVESRAVGDAAELSYSAPGHASPLTERVEGLRAVRPTTCPWPGQAWELVGPLTLRGTEPRPALLGWPRAPRAWTREHPHLVLVLRDPPA